MWTTKLCCSNLLKVIHGIMIRWDKITNCMFIRLFNSKCMRIIYLSIYSSIYRLYLKVKDPKFLITFDLIMKFVISIIDWDLTRKIDRVSQNKMSTLEMKQYESVLIVQIWPVYSGDISFNLLAICIVFPCLFAGIYFKIYILKTNFCSCKWRWKIPKIYLKIKLIQFW